MAGDLDYLATLDDKQFNAALKRLDSTIEAERAKMDKGFFGKQLDKEVLGINKLGKAVGFGIAGAFALAGKAVAEYAERSGSARYELEQLGLAKDRLFDSIGQEVVASGVMEGLEVAVRALGDAYRWTTDKAREMANILERLPEAGKKIGQSAIGLGMSASMGPGGLAGAVVSGEFGQFIDETKGTLGLMITGAQSDTAATRRALDDQMAAEARQRFRGAISEKMGAFRGAGLDDVGRARAQAAMIEQEAEQFINKEKQWAMMSGLGSNEADAIAGDYLRAAGRAGSDLITAAEFAKSKRDSDANARRAGVYDSVADDKQRAALAVMRAKGLDKQADAAEIELGYQEKILKVLSDQNLSYIQRFDLVQGLDDARTGELAAIELEASRAKGATTLDAGLGGSGVAGMVFGVGGSGANDIARNTKRSADDLSAIRRRLESGTVATFN